MCIKTNPKGTFFVTLAKKPAQNQGSSSVHRMTVLEWSQGETVKVTTAKQILPDSRSVNIAGERLRGLR